jgi:4-hydroxybenzoate polyprenyltransferase
MARRPDPNVVGSPTESRPEDAARRPAVSLFVSLRPHQWTKNLIIFAALIFGRRLDEPAAVVRTVEAFGLFCVLSGVVYLINDVVDRTADRRHPAKARRPIAAGDLAPGVAIGAAVALAVGGLAGAFALGRPFGLVAAGYVTLLALYSGPLKRIVIVDVLTIAMGFVLRAVAGAVVVDVPISHWLLVLTVMLALFLGFSKRRQELVSLAADAAGHRENLSRYTATLLDQLIAITAAGTLIAYAIYTISPETIEKFGSGQLGLTLPFPVYGIFRYLYLVYQEDGGGSPAEALVTDRPLLLCVGLWGLAAIAIIYAGPLPL